MRWINEPSVAQELIRARRTVLSFRAKWMRAFEEAGAKRLSFGCEPNIRCVFALPDDHTLIEQFESARGGLRTRLAQKLKSIGRAKAPEMWLPTLARSCIRVRVSESEPVQQLELSLQQARAFARKCGVQEIGKDGVYVLRRYASTPELLIETEVGGAKGWSAEPFTEWAVIGCSAPITNRSELRPRKWSGRPSAQSQNEAWAGRRKMNLICQSGQASLYGGSPVQPRGPDGEEELFLG